MWDPASGSDGVGGQTILYTVTVSNPGATALTDVEITDAIDSSLTNINPLNGGIFNARVITWPTIPVFAAGDTVSVQFEADVKFGLVINPPTAIFNTGNISSQDLFTDVQTNTTVHQVTGNPSIVLNKAVTPDNFAAPGSATYTYTVTNTGDVTLNNVSVTDDNATPGDTGDDFTVTMTPAILAPGAQATGTATLTVDQDDIDGGADIVNIAIASSDEASSGPATATVTVTRTPRIVVVKTPDLPTLVNAALNGTVVFSYEVSNNGNVTLENPVLTDDLESPLIPIPFDTVAGGFIAGDTDQDGKLDLGETWTATVDHSVTQDDLDAGQIGTDGALAGELGTATVTATGALDTDPGGVLLAQNPVIEVLKTADVASVAAPRTITYSYDVTNGGNVSLSNVTLGDNNTDAPPVFDSIDGSNTGDTDGDDELDVGETWSYTATHTVSQADIDSGASIVNLATANSTESEPDTGTVTVTVTQNPGIVVQKTPDITNTSTAVNAVLLEDITFTYTVTNSGNVALENPVLTDDLESPVLPIPFDTVVGFIAGDTDQDGKLDLGETWTATVDHSVTQADLDAGQIGTDGALAGELGTATVTATGALDTDPGGVLLAQNPVIEVLKTADVASVAAPGTVTYSYDVTNGGNVSLSNVTLGDNNTDAAPVFDSVNGSNTGDTDGDDELDVGETWSYTATHTVSQADIDSGTSIVNLATADSTESDPDTSTVTVTVTQNPGIVVQKTPDITINSTAVNAVLLEDITFTYTVTNSGNVTLENLVLTGRPRVAGATDPIRHRRRRRLHRRGHRPRR